MKIQTLIGILTVTALVLGSSTVRAGANPRDEAKARFDDRQYKQAISIVKHAVRRNGASADLLVVMADCYTAMGKAGKAEKIYRQALALEPGHTQGTLNFGMLLVAQRERGEAIALFKSVLAKQPDHARAHYCLGMAYNARADINDAFAQYKILKRLDKTLAAELYNAIFSK